MKQQFLEDKADTIRMTVYDKNRPIVPTAATVTLYKPAGGTPLQAEATATIDSTTGEMTYSLTSTHTADRGLNFIASWKYTSNGIDYYQNQLFDVVRSILAIPITDDDIYAELESLRKSNNQATGTATAGAAGSLTDTAKRKEPDDFWKGGIIEILTGTGSSQRRDITGNTQSTSVITVTPNWTTTPDSTSVYRVVRSFSEKINQAFKKLETMLYNKGNRHQLILESSQIEVPLLFLTIHTICLDIRDELDDKWDMLAKDYKEKFEQSFTTMKLEYDEDDSGTIQGQDEEQQNPSSLRIFRT